MTTDSGATERRPRPDFRLPRVLSIKARAIGYSPSEKRNFRSRIPALESTVEFAVETEAPIPIRALGPVLYIGDTAVTECIADDDTHYRFIALEPGALRVGAPITLGWAGGADDERVDVSERFVAPEGFAPGKG